MGEPLEGKSRGSDKGTRDLLKSFPIVLGSMEKCHIIFPSYAHNIPNYFQRSVKQELHCTEYVPFF